MDGKDVAERVTQLAFAGRYEDALELVDPDVELVTRNGPVRGEAALAYLQEFFARQREVFEFEHVIERTVEAGDGTFVVLSVVRRKAKDGAGYLKAWPATVIRVRDGRVVFAEGYPDRRDALQAVGASE